MPRAAAVIECVVMLPIGFVGGPMALVLAILFAVHFVNGCFVTMSSVHALAYRQAVAPESLLGRITAGYRFISYGSIPIALLGGLAGEWLGLRGGLILGTAAGGSGADAARSIAMGPEGPFARATEHPQWHRSRDRYAPRMNRLGAMFEGARRRWTAIGVLALGAIAGALLAAVVFGRPDTGEAGSTPSSTPVSVASATPSPAPRPTPTPSAGATEPPTATDKPTQSPSEPGWNAVAIDGIHDVAAVYERDGRLFASGWDVERTAVIMASDDGETWMPVDLSAVEAAAWHSLVQGESGFVAVSAHYPTPMGMPELEYLYSPDGQTWTSAEPPADCVSAVIVARGAGFLGLGDRCRTEGDFGPGSLHILESPDGRAWTSRRDETMRPGQWTIDGDRIVMLQQEGDFATGVINPWISDDGARTWRRAEVPFPDGFIANGILLHGHGVYVAPASWSGGDGDPQSAVCTSSDGDAWSCQIIGEMDGLMAGRNWLARQIVVTPTGFASLVEYVNDPFFGGDGSIDMVLATSRDGLNWTFAPEPELKDKLPAGLAWTSHGLYSWGVLNRDITPDAPVPYLVVREASLP